MKSLLLVALTAAAFQVGSARVFGTCDLAQELLWNGFDRGNLEHWVCLIMAESSGNTNVIGPPNTDGSRDWGLFQINDRYWCVPGTPGNGCGITCESLLTDDIGVASSCARLIWNAMGFSAWTGWVSKCQGALPDLGGCGI